MQARCEAGWSGFSLAYDFSLPVSRSQGTPCDDKDNDDAVNKFTLGIIRMYSFAVCTKKGHCVYVAVCVHTHIHLQPQQYKVHM